MTFFVLCFSFLSFLFYVFFKYRKRSLIGTRSLDAEGEGQGRGTPGYSMPPSCVMPLDAVTNAHLIEVLFKLRCIIVDVINVDDDVSSCCVPTVRYLQHRSNSSSIKNTSSRELKTRLY